MTEGFRPADAGETIAVVMRDVPPCVFKDVNGWPGIEYDIVSAA